MSDAIAYLSRAIERGQGLAEADVVLKGGRIFDLGDRRTRGERRRHQQRPHRRNDGRIPRRARDRRAGKGRRSGLHRYALPCRVVAHHAARVRPLRPAAWSHDGDLRSARDRQCPRSGGPALLPRRRHGDRDGPSDSAFELRSRNEPRDGGRPARGRRPPCPGRSPEGAGPRRVHELSRPSGPRSGLSRQARRVPDPADRRAQPASRAAMR